jgi:hypothetical protein
MEKTTTTKDMTREEILLTSLAARQQEVMHYQINIDNYTIALEEIDKLPADEGVEMYDFANQLKKLLATETLEQKKAKIMLSVIQRQVA